MDYKIIRSRRKTISIQIKPNGEVIVRAPLRMSERNINKVIKEKESWLQRHLEKIEMVEPFSKEEIESCVKKAKILIPERVKIYAEKMSVTYGRITIRKQKTRWGSCSSKGNLNFNCLLVLAPLDVIDSVVVHELCHIKEMNHSRKFYNEVYKVYPEYDRCNKWLKDNGRSILARLYED